MKSILNQFHEISLDVLTEDEGGLVCIVSPMKVDSKCRIIEDPAQLKYAVNFGVVSGYLVVPEIIQAGLCLKYSDGSIISEVFNSDMLENFGFTAFQKANKHYVLRTSHQYVNVFVDVDVDVDVDELFRVFPVDLERG